MNPDIENFILNQDNDESPASFRIQYRNPIYVLLIFFSIVNLIFMIYLFDIVFLFKIWI